MRKLLLATVAALGVSAGMADTGFAQSSDDFGQASPAPGTITVRLNGRVRVFGGVIGDSDANQRVFYNPATGSAAEAIPLPGGGFGVRSSTTGAIVAPGAGGIFAPGTARGSRWHHGGGRDAEPGRHGSDQQAGQLRDRDLYPSVSGLRRRGGERTEIRRLARNPAGQHSGSGGGVYGSLSQQSRQRGELYLRREWGYIGTDQLGTLRLGSTDGPSGLYMVGNFENFNDGGWNGDVPGMISGNVQPTWPLPTSALSTPRTRSSISRRSSTASISASPTSRARAT